VEWEDGGNYEGVGGGRGVDFEGDLGVLWIVLMGE
jgi:hypothetical protein